MKAVAAWVARIAAWRPLEILRGRLRASPDEEGVEGGAAKRTREEHDRLLQDFIGTIFIVQAARNLLSEHPERAAELLDGALEEGDQAVRQGRLALEEASADAGDPDDVAEAISALGRELQEGDGCEGLAYRVLQHGHPRALHPLLRDGIYGIVRTAVRDAARHARPSLVEVELHFAPERFRVLVRDDGQGIEAAASRPAGGERVEALRRLAVLRQHAREHGGRLEAWSRPGAGTEIELTFTALQAYATKGERP